jgi:chromate transporter
VPARTDPIVLGPRAPIEGAKLPAMVPHLPPARQPSRSAALRAWLYVGLNSFGGPAGQVAVMHREIVERRGWMSERSFLHALNFSMLLPGPEAQQLATYIGWRLNGVAGGLAAGLLFILPGALVIMALSALYALFEGTAFVDALFYGIKPAVVALVVGAVYGLARRVLAGRAAWLIAGAAFGAIFFLDIPFPVIVLGAALAGWLVARLSRRDGDSVSQPVTAPDGRRVERPATSRALTVLAVAAVLWLVPSALAVAVLGPASVYAQLAAFFSVAALVTFGGAYAVLAFVAQQAVGGFGWLSAEQMLDGLGLAESTPGPLIMVVQFVGFMAAFGVSDGLDPLAAGILGGLLVTWVTFVPSFGIVLAGAPYVEYLQGQPQLTAALRGITAAVVGVILNLGLWFGLQTVFTTTGELRLGPLRLHTAELVTLDPVALGLVGLSLIVLLRLRWPLLVTLGLSAAIGLGYRLAAG